MQLAGSSLVSCDSVKTVPLSTPQAALYCHLNIFMNKDTMILYDTMISMKGKETLIAGLWVGGCNSQSCHC